MIDDNSFVIYSWTREHLNNVVLRGKSPIITDTNLANAFEKIDRADFLPENLKANAYADVDLEFAMGESVNSPILTAQMLMALNLAPGQKVLELGTGSGYSLAIIAEAIGQTGKIFSLDRNQQILSIARKNLAKYTNLKNYELVFRDGQYGLDTRSPFDAIYINFSFETFPEDLIDQLKIGGRLITPLTNSEIYLYTRVGNQEITKKIITARHFAKFQHGIQ